MMPVAPRRLVRVARVGPRRLRRSERQGLAEEIDRPQFAIRVVAQREVLLPEQAHERVGERDILEAGAHSACTGLPADRRPGLVSDLLQHRGERRFYHLVAEVIRRVRDLWGASFYVGRGGA